MPLIQPADEAPARRRLDRQMIVEQALRLARAEGLAAVAMRRVAEELGIAPTSLYRHVGDREDLLIAMLGEVAANIELLPAMGDPRAEITAVFTAIHDALRRDPWAVQLIVTHKLASPLVLPALERVFAALRQAGFTPRDATVTYALLWHYTAGELLDAHHDVPNSYQQTMIRAADPTIYPALLESVAAVSPGARGTTSRRICIGSSTACSGAPSRPPTRGA